MDLSFTQMTDSFETMKEYITDVSTTPSSMETYLVGHGITIDASSHPFMAFRWPLAGVLFYYLTIWLYQPGKTYSKVANTPDASKKKREVRRKRILRKRDLFVFLHNMCLCIFSLLCFLNTAPIVWNHFRTRGFREGTCTFHETFVLCTLPREM